MKIVCSGLRDDGHLPHRTEFGGVVGQIDLHFLEGLNVIGQRAGLRIVDAVGESGAVDRPVFFVDAAAAKADHAAAGLLLQARRQGQICVKAPGIEWNGVQYERSLGVRNPGGFGFNQRGAPHHLDGRIHGAHLELDIHTADVARLQGDVLQGEGTEARSFRSH